jgi:hypothetical protein
MLRTRQRSRCPPGSRPTQTPAHHRGRDNARLDRRHTCTWHVGRRRRRWWRRWGARVGHGHPPRRQCTTPNIAWRRCPAGPDPSRRVHSGSWTQCNGKRGSTQGRAPMGALPTTGPQGEASTGKRTHAHTHPVSVRVSSAFTSSAPLPSNRGEAEDQHSTEHSTRPNVSRPGMGAPTWAETPAVRGVVRTQHVHPVLREASHPKRHTHLCLDRCQHLCPAVDHPDPCRAVGLRQQSCLYSDGAVKRRRAQQGGGGGCVCGRVRASVCWQVFEPCKGPRSHTVSPVVQPPSAITSHTQVHTFCDKLLLCIGHGVALLGRGWDEGHSTVRRGRGDGEVGT